MTGGMDRKLTQPLGGAVATILMFIGALLVTGLLLLPWNHVSLGGYGTGPACATVPLNGITEADTGKLLAHLRPGAYASTGEHVLACVNRPTLGQRTLVTLTQIPTVVLYLAILLLLWQLVSTARRAGPFAPLMAARLRFLAWFILVGVLMVTAGESIAQSVYASTVVADSVPVVSNVVNAELSGFVPPVLIACGLLTLARVMRLGARMSDDLAGTV
ncbi:MAG: DUF2975 domain-containing protein [Streptosporangiaceae bacterium]